MTPSERLELAVRICNRHAPLPAGDVIKGIANIIAEFERELEVDSKAGELTNAMSIADLRTHIDTKYEELHDEIQDLNNGVAGSIQILKDRMSKLSVEMETADMKLEDRSLKLSKYISGSFIDATKERQKLEARIRKLEDAQKSRPAEDVLEGIPEEEWMSVITSVHRAYESTRRTTTSFDREIKILKRFLREHVLKEQQ